MIEVAIIDDDDVLRPKIKRLLNNSENIRCRLDARNLGDFFENITADLRINVLLLDIQLAERSSLDYLENLRRLLPDTKIIIFTGYEDPGFLVRAMRDGADGYLVKGAHPKKLLEVIQITFAGEVFIEPKVVAEALPIFRRMVLPVTEQSPDWSVTLSNHGLTEREIQIALGILKGSSYKEMAAKNNLALNTVRHYIKLLYRKMEVNNKIQMIQKMKEMF